MVVRRTPSGTIRSFQHTLLELVNMGRGKAAVILLGPPGSGKTTIADDVTSRWDVAVIKTGQLLRREIKKKTTLGKRLKPFLDAGKLAPSAWVAEVIEEEIRHIHNHWIWFDGFPRREDEIEPFFRICKKGNMYMAAAVVLQISRSLAAKRLTGRRVCPNCHAVYNIYFDPPERDGICDHCGTPLEQRKDDTMELVNQRWQVYEEETKPVIAYLTEHHPQRTHLIPAEESAEKKLNSILSMM